MDVVRLVEELKDTLDIQLQNTDVFMSPVFSEFAATAILARRGANAKQNVNYDAIEIRANNMDLRFPKQLFVNGRFVNGRGKAIPSINPHDESVICMVESASVDDVDDAVKAAKAAFEDGEWSKISARERGALLFKYVALVVVFYFIFLNI